MRKTLLILAVVLLNIQITMADIIPAGGVVFVTENGTGNGSSWANASSLIEALDAAKADPAIKEIQVAVGTYIAASSPFIVPSGITLSGGYPDENNLSATTSTLTANNSGRVLIAINKTPESVTTIQGFTITNGRISGKAYNLKVDGHFVDGRFGGGIYAYTENGGTIVLKENIIENNNIVATVSSDNIKKEIITEEDLAASGKDQFYEVVADRIAYVASNLIKTAAGTIGCTSACGVIVGKLADKIIESLLGFVMELSGLDEVIGNIFGHQFELYTLEVHLAACGGGVFAQGNVELRNNTIRNNSVVATSQALLQGARTWGIAGSYCFVALPVVDVRGGGIYINGEALLENNIISGNTAQGIAETEMRAGFNLEGYFEKSLFSSSPIACGYGGGLYVDGDVILRNNQLTNNGLKTDTESTRSFSFQGLKRSTTFDISGKSFSYGGGAYFTGNADIQDNDFSNNYINTTTDLSDGGSAFTIPTGMSLGYGAGAMIHTVDGYNEIKVSNNRFIGNEFSKGICNINGGCSAEKAQTYPASIVSGGALAIDNAAGDEEDCYPNLFNIELTSNTFNENKTKNSTDVKGGVLFLNNINANLKDNTISNNQIEVFNETDYRFLSVKGSIKWGIGKVVDYIPSYFRNKRANSFIAANAQITGGIIYASNCNPTSQIAMENMTIKNNILNSQTSSKLWEATARLESSLFTSILGGVYLNYPTVKVSDSEIVGNKLSVVSNIDQRGHNYSYATAKGTGIYLDQKDGCKATLQGNTISDNELNANIKVKGDGLIFNPSDDSIIELDAAGTAVYADSGSVKLLYNNFAHNLITINASAAGATHNGDNDITALICGGAVAAKGLSGVENTIQNNFFTSNGIKITADGDDRGTNSSDVQALAYGGGMYLGFNNEKKGKALFVDNEFFGNTLYAKVTSDQHDNDHDASAFGGGLHLIAPSNTSVILTKNTFTKNEIHTITGYNDGKAYSCAYGGGIYMLIDGNVTADRLILTENKILAQGTETGSDDESNANAFGGAIYASPLSRTYHTADSYCLNLTNSLIVKNRVDAKVTKETEIIGSGTHSARSRGGGVFLNLISAKLTNLTIADNDLWSYPDKINKLVLRKDFNGYRDGAGIYSEMSYIDIGNSILTCNYRKVREPGHTMDMQNIEKDKDDRIKKYTKTSSINVFYSMLDQGVDYIDGTSIYGNPLFAEQGIDYHLHTNSPGIDKGNNFTLPNDYRKYDLAGRSRIANFNVDMGAYEATISNPDRYGILYVKKGGAGNQTGSSWENALPEVAFAFQDAIKDSRIKQIWVAEGTYNPLYSITPTSSIWSCRSFILPNNVEIYGGFPTLARSIQNSPKDNTTEEIQRALNTRNWNLCETILSGNLGHGMNVYHVVIAPGTTGSALDGFTIEGGEAMDSSQALLDGDYSIPNNSGAGIYNYSANYRLSNLTVKDNRAKFGGGIYNFMESQVNINNTSFLNNEASNDGGAIYNNSSEFLIVNSEFKENNANNGGAFYNNNTSNKSTTLKLVNVLVAENTANVDGGGIYNKSTSNPSAKPTVELLNSTVVNNRSKSSTKGIGIHYEGIGEGMKLSNSIVWGNGTTLESNMLGLYTSKYSILQGSINTENGNLNSDPLFLDSENSNYSLKRLSPARNAGSNDLYSVPTYGDLDLAGNSRINPHDLQNSNKIDMGAYEFYGTQPDAHGVMYVKQGGSGNRLGYNWANAYPALAQALYDIYKEDANTIKEIWVAEGTYHPYILEPSSGENLFVDPEDHTFLLSKGIKLYGGFPADANDRINAPNEILSVDQARNTRDWTRYSSILDGCYTPYNADSPVNVRHVVYGHDILLENSNKRTVIDGFTITGGNASGSIGTTQANGGGVHLQDVSMELINLVVCDNQANESGGGIYNQYKNNTTIPGILIMNNVSVERNTSQYSGAGIASGGLLKVINSKITNNKAGSSYTNGYGGGIYYVQQSGVIPILKTNYPFNDWIVENNDIAVDIINSLITGNEATQGGAVSMVTNEKNRILNTTIADNIGNTVCGIDNAIASETVIINSILWNNGSTYSSNLMPSSSLELRFNIIQGYRDTGGSSISVGNIASNPLFQSANSTDYFLSDTSPAIDHGNDQQYTNASAFAGNYDLLNNPRMHVAFIDAGAYEYQLNATPDDRGIVYVDDSKSGDGSSWAKAYPSIHEPLIKAKSDKRIKEIWVAHGKYSANGATIELVQGVKLYGGFVGFEDDIKQRNLPSFGDIISDDERSIITATYLQANNIYYTPYDETANILIDGFTFSGMSNKAAVFDNTNALYTVRNSHFINNYMILKNSDDSNFSFENCVIEKNNAAISINNTNSELRINNSHIGYNRSDFFGFTAVKNCEASKFQLLNTLVDGNSCNSNDKTALFENSDETSFSIFNSTITNNWFNPDGNTPIISGGTGTIYNSILDYNHSDASWIDSNWDIRYSNVKGYVSSGMGNLDVNSLFENDRSLKPKSPMIDAGSNEKYGGVSLDTEYDLAGNPRLNGEIIDMGAFEALRLQPNAVGIMYVNHRKKGDGSSWEEAYHNLADALIAAKENPNIKQIWVANGTYIPSYQAADAGGSDEKDKAFVLPAKIKLYGGFAGHERSINERDISNNETVLSAKPYAGDNLLKYYHVMIISGCKEENAVVVDGFTIQDGYAFDNQPEKNISVNGRLVSSYYGGGIYIVDSDCDLFNLTIKNNTARGEGGGVFIRSTTPATLKLKKVTFRSNSANIGGGIAAHNTELSMLNCLSVYNAASEGSAIHFNTQHPLTIVNSTIAGNSESSKSKPAISLDGSNSADFRFTAQNSIIGGRIDVLAGKMHFHSVNLPTEIIFDSNDDISNRTEFKTPFLKGGFTLDPDNLNNIADLIDKGNNAYYYGDLFSDTDLDGNPRLYNRIDIGAYEVQANIFPDDQGIIYVNHLKNGDGSSWENAYPNLADPLAKARTDKRITQIWVADGTYLPLHNASDELNTDKRNQAFILPEIGLYGGFAGNESDINERNLSSYTTVLSGKLSETESTYHVLIASGSEEDPLDNAILDGFTISEATASTAVGTTKNSMKVNGNVIYYGGGAGIHNVNASYTIRNLIIEDNKSEMGTAIYNKNTTLSVTNSILRNNTTTVNALVAATDGRLDMINVLITGNEGCSLFCDNDGSTTGNQTFRLVNNTIVENTGIAPAKIFGIWDFQTTSSTELFNSIIYDNGNNMIPETVTSDYNLVGTDPLFVNETYVPGYTSPAIDASDNGYYLTSYESIDLAGNPRINNNTIDIGAFESTLTPVLRWTGLAEGDGNNWNNAANWFPEAIPTQHATVYVPGNVENYPFLTGDRGNNLCNEIYFLHGAEMGRPDLLYYVKAHVQLNMGLLNESSPQSTNTDYTDHLAYSAEHSDSPLSRGGWHTLSMPLQNVVTGDLSFGGYPNTFLRKFSAKADADAEFLVGSWSNYFRTNAETLKSGEGFVYWMHVYEDIPFRQETGQLTSMQYPKGGTNYGLKEVNGIIELPFFENQAMSQAHRLHSYDESTEISSFGRIDTDLEDLPMIPNDVDTVGRSSYYAYRFAFETSGNLYPDVSYPVTFSENFALVGNPYLSAIDFDAFALDNQDVIKPNYQLWTGNGFAVYSNGNVSGTGNIIGITGKIAPMQSFLVERATTANENVDLIFDLKNISITGSDGLRNSESESGEKIEITANNKAGSILTFVAYNEDGSKDLGNMDSRKIIMGIGEMPEVYTLKKHGDSRVALAGNYINSNTMLIPIGLATSSSGSTTLVLKGMNNYNGRVNFIDTEAQENIDISKEEVYEYTFNYTPNWVDGKVMPTNNRFFLRILPIYGDSGLDDTDNKVYAYYERGIVNVVSLSEDIQDIYIYDSRGNLLYSNPGVNTLLHQVNMGATASQICILKLVTQTRIVNLKLLIKN